MVEVTLRRLAQLENSQMNWGSSERAPKTEGRPETVFLFHPGNQPRRGLGSFDPDVSFDFHSLEPVPADFAGD